MPNKIINTQTDLKDLFRQMSPPMKLLVGLVSSGCISYYLPQYLTVMLSGWGKNVLVNHLYSLANIVVLILINLIGFKIKKPLVFGIILAVMLDIIVVILMGMEGKNIQMILRSWHIFLFITLAPIMNGYTFIRFLRYADHSEYFSQKKIKA